MANVTQLPDARRWQVRGSCDGRSARAPNHAERRLAASSASYCRPHKRAKHRARSQSRRLWSAPCKKRGSNSCSECPSLAGPRASAGGLLFRLSRKLDSAIANTSLGSSSDLRVRYTFEVLEGQSWSELPTATRPRQTAALANRSLPSRVVPDDVADLAKVLEDKANSKRLPGRRTSRRSPGARRGC